MQNFSLQILKNLLSLTSPCIRVFYYQIALYCYPHTLNIVTRQYKNGAV